ncbi:trehalose-phosphatase [Salinarimonas sp.]|uniref:trehalose-phosphatase n=1 Tax=Salinarimonas sp. TaxID=2766526 RepID=UPI003919F470
MNGGERSVRIEAALLDMDGVVTDTALAHAAAWKRLFDDWLGARAQRTGESFVPFDADADYQTFVDGKPRLDGIASFLASRGIDLPRGDESDAPGSDTLWGLGHAKNAHFQAWLGESAVEAFPGTLAFVADLRAAGVKVALFTSSRNAQAVLRSAGIADLFDAIVDGEATAQAGLPGKPDPAIMLEAARRLGIAPERALVVEDATAGVEAGARGPFACVVAVDREKHADALARAGADIVVADLAELAYDAREGLRVKTLRNLPSLFDREDEIRARLRGKSIAVFLDYDGTLTPIVEDPNAARFGEAMREAVVGLARACPTAIVSGRDLPDVQRMVALDAVYYAGSHGFDMAGPDGWRETVALGRAFQPDLAQAADALEAALVGIDGTAVERKSFSLAVHYRRVAPADEARVFEAVERTIAAFGRLKLSRGKKVFDVKPRADWHKGRAIRALIAKLGLDRPDVVPVFVGDDVTDEDAFRAIADRGLCVVVRSEEPRPTSARYALDDVPDVARFLQLLRRMQDEGGPA